MKRIAFVRIAQETNGLSPVLTEVESFERTHFLSGQALLDCCARWQTEAKGFLRNAELSGFVRAARTFLDVEIVPLFSAWAVSGGRSPPPHLRGFAPILWRRWRRPAPSMGCSSRCMVR